MVARVVVAAGALALFGSFIASLSGEWYSLTNQAPVTGVCAGLVVMVVLQLMFMGFGGKSLWKLMYPPIPAAAGPSQSPPTFSVNLSASPSPTSN